MIGDTFALVLEDSFMSSECQILGWGFTGIILFNPITRCGVAIRFPFYRWGKAVCAGVYSGSPARRWRSRVQMQDLLILWLEPWPPLDSSSRRLALFHKALLSLLDRGYTWKEDYHPSGFWSMGLFYDKGRKRSPARDHSGRRPGGSLRGTLLVPSAWIGYITREKYNKTMLGKDWMSFLDGFPIF